MRGMMASFAVVGSVAAGGVIPREYAENITVYHVNPMNYSYAPINMDTGNSLGDLYFDLRSVDLPIECSNPKTARSSDCKNQEVVSGDLGITRLTIEVDKRYYGEYARCNICVNGTDHDGHNNCKDGEYVCSCGGFVKPSPCDERYVGVSNLSTRYENSSSTSKCLEPWSSQIDCWRMHVVDSTGGLWFSTLKGGYCDGGSDCTWRVAGDVKRINKTCSDESIYSNVEAADKSGCFSGCGATRNTTSPCWIKCFYDTVLGPNSDSYKWRPNTGFNKEQLAALWESPFKTCPSA